MRVSSLKLPNQLEREYAQQNYKQRQWQLLGQYRLDWSTDRVVVTLKNSERVMMGAGHIERNLE